MIRQDWEKAKHEEIPIVPKPSSNQTATNSLKKLKPLQPKPQYLGIRINTKITWTEKIFKQQEQPPKPTAQTQPESQKMSEPPKINGFEKWKNGLTNAPNSVGWNLWDCEIQLATNDYNRHLSGTPGYRNLDWHIIKAMTWVETGASSEKWTSNPMQIGNPGDPGLKSLLTGNEGGDLIIPAEWKPSLTTSSATTIPKYNIRAGIGYLLMRLANYSIKSTPTSDSTVYEVKVKAGDSMDRISREKGTTADVIKKINSDLFILRPGQTIKYQKATMKKFIQGWKPITTQNIAKYYNVGDSMYPRKLEHALALIKMGQPRTCTP